MRVAARGRAIHLSPFPLAMNLISRMVSVDVKRHVSFHLTTQRLFFFYLRPGRFYSKSCLTARYQLIESCDPLAVSRVLPRRARRAHAHIHTCMHARIHLVSPWILTRRQPHRDPPQERITRIRAFAGSCCLRKKIQEVAMEMNPAVTLDGGWYIQTL